MLVHIRRAVVVSIVFFVVLGVAFPALLTGIGQVFFSHTANGSLTANGSTIIGQTWTGPKWFQGRPDGDNPLATGSQNYGPKSKLLESFVAKEAATLRKEGITPTNDLVTGSGSGVDPDIAPADAYAQASAVAKANHLPLAKVDALIKANIVSAYWGFLGAPYIDVLQLNEGLAQLTK
jgi:K+-transporting ATPase ATPase C chain